MECNVRCLFRCATRIAESCRRANPADYRRLKKIEAEFDRRRAAHADS
jgi:hypothetical protein